MSGLYRGGAQDASISHRYFVVAISAVLIMLGMYAVSDRLDRELVNAERAQLFLRIAELNASVTLMQASYVAQGKEHELAELVGSNPMRWFRDDVRYYLGEQSIASSQDIKGQWLFDPELGELAYQPKDLPVAVLRAELEKSQNRYSAFLGEEQKVSGSNNYAQWLRFRVVGLLSKEENTRQKEPAYQSLTLQLVQ